MFHLFIGTNHFGTFTNAKYKILCKSPSLAVKVFSGGGCYFSYCLCMYNLKHSTQVLEQLCLGKHHEVYYYVSKRSWKVYCDLRCR